MAPKTPQAKREQYKRTAKKKAKPKGKGKKLPPWLTKKEDK